MSTNKLESAIALVESIGLPDQKFLRSVLSDLIYKKKPVHVQKKGEDPAALVSTGLVVVLDDPAGLVLAPEYSSIGRKLCTYLTRRNETELYFDPDRGMIEIPKGAQYVACVSISGEPSLCLAFPDDEITALLDRHGVNRCRKEGD